MSGNRHYHYHYYMVIQDKRSLTLNMQLKWVLVKHVRNKNNNVALAWVPNYSKEQQWISLLQRSNRSRDSTQEPVLVVSFLATQELVASYWLFLAPEG